MPKHLTIIVCAVCVPPSPDSPCVKGGGVVQVAFLAICVLRLGSGLGLRLHVSAGGVWWQESQRDLGHDIPSG